MRCLHKQVRRQLQTHLEVLLKLHRVLLSAFIFTLNAKLFGNSRLKQDRKHRARRPPQPVASLCHARSNGKSHIPCMWLSSIQQPTVNVFEFFLANVFPRDILEHYFPRKDHTTELHAIYGSFPVYVYWHNCFCMPQLN